MKKEKRLGRFYATRVGEIKSFFDDIYFALTDTEVIEPVVICGSELSFDHKHFDFKVYGSLDGRLVCQSLSGDSRVLNKRDVLDRLRVGFWQYGFIKPEQR